MTADEIVTAFLTQPVTALRVKKLVQLCQRMRVEIDQVLAALPPAVRTEVEALR